MDGCIKVLPHQPLSGGRLQMLRQYSMYPRPQHLCRSETLSFSMYSLQPTAYSLQPTAYSLQPTAYSMYLRPSLCCSEALS